MSTAETKQPPKAKRGRAATVVPPGFLSTKEAATILGRGPRVVTRLGRSGHLSVNQVGTCAAFYRRDEVEALARRMGVTA